MNAERLLALFEEISEAPDAIARLRRFILDLAVRGKLVEQDPEDESAGELLQCLRKNGGKPHSSAPDSDSFPFALPVGWATATLGNLVQASNSGWSPKTLDLPREGEEWGILKVSAVSWERFRPDANKQVLPGTQPKPQAVVKNGDFLISRANTAELVARAVIVDCDPVNLMMSDKIVRLQLVELCEPRYILIVNNHATFARSYYASYATGVSPSMKNVSRDVILGLPLPLPPLAEQHRIVAKVDELMDLCDQLEAARMQREQCRERLVAASLQRLNQPSDEPEIFRSVARFALQVLPSLTSTPAQVKQLRQTILNLAVRGKLVEQDPEDEPAELLLQCLQQHSRKSGSPAFKGESLPFDLPVGWAPASLGDMVQASNSGWSPKTLDVPRQDEEWGILKVSAVSWERFQPNANKQVLPGTQPKPQAVVEKGDFLISRANTAELVARAVIVDCDPVNLMMSDKIVRLQFVELCEPRYILIVNNHANFARSYFANHATGVSPSMKNVSRDVILGLPLPLPPLAEQHRIVAKVDELMTLCDQLEQQLSQGEESRRGLREAVLREALAGRLPERPEERHAAL
jgi:type I restriction enzyme S subunit